MNAAAFLGGAVALVALTSIAPGTADPIRWTLFAIILLVLLRNAPAVGAGLDRFVRSLGGASRSTPSDTRRATGGIHPI